VLLVWIPGSLAQPARQNGRALPTSSPPCKQVEEHNTVLRREKLERAVVDGALEISRKECARLMREMMGRQRGVNTSSFEHFSIAGPTAWRCAVLPPTIILKHLIYRKAAPASPAFMAW
jgi:hypothetical protein